MSPDDGMVEVVQVLPRRRVLRLREGEIISNFVDKGIVTTFRLQYCK